LSSLALYFYSVRHLRPIQIAARVWFRLHRPTPDQRAAPSTRSMQAQYQPPVAPASSLLAPDRFRFLNVVRRCSIADDWQPADMAKLWTYHLHYFDDLNARDAQARVAWHEDLLVRWATENPPGQGDGWEPYPMSRRIVNCVKWAARGNVLLADLQASLAVQARWLTQRLEYHILGNHLLTNAKALVHAGLYFDGAEARRWYNRGLKILECELQEQVLPDGGHFELSTMYHAGILEDLLDLVNLLRAYDRQPPATWFADIARMRHWLRVMSHPDGGISFFNDAAFGVTPTFAQLEDYALRLGLPATAVDSTKIVVLEASGYVSVRAGSAYLLCDCATVGPDHLPAHAHADTLSFELSVAGQRVFVNSGTSQYGSDAERQRQRGTAAHNTVVVDGQNSSEVWAGFRVARRARIVHRTITSTPVATIIEASHDGYRRLRGRNEHWRRWTVADRSLCIEDKISGKFASAAAYFHLHPEIDARACGTMEILLSGSDGVSVRVLFTEATEIAVLPGTWHPGFGAVLANRYIIARFSGATLTTRISWATAQ
jgi:uncharacterized heparinase superfamily protein